MWATNTLSLFHSRRAQMWGTGVCLLLILLLNLCIFTPTTHAVQTIPYKMNFQGRLTDASGNIKADGQYNMKLRLWTASTSGSNVWTEIRGDNGVTNTNRVQVTNGLFSIQLGDVTALSPTLFSNGTYPLFLEVELPTPGTALCTGINCTSYTEGAMTPRSALGSSGYAFSADTVDGIDGSSMARVDAGNTFTASNSYNSGTTNTFNGNLVVNNTETVTNNSLIGFNIAGTTGAYTLQAAGTGGYFYSDGTNVHVGMTSSGSGGASTSPTTIANDSGLISHDGNYSAAINTGVNWGSNMAPNPGFEHGCAAWTNCNLETTNINSGNNASRVVTTVGSPVKTTTSSGAVAVRPGDMYYFSGFAKASAANIGTLKIGYDQFDKNNVFISTLSINIANNPSSFTHFEVTTTVATNAAYIKPIVATNGDGAASGNWYIDDLLLLHQDQPMQPIFKSPVDATTAFQIQNAGGTALFVADAVNKAIKIGGGDVSPDGSPTLVVLDYKNTSGDPTGTNGAMYYNSASQKFRCFEDSLWRDCISSGRTRYEHRQDFLGAIAWANGNSIDGTFIVGASNSTFAVQAGDASHPGITRMTLTWNFANAIAGISSNYTATNNLLFGGGAWSTTLVAKLNVISNATNAYTMNTGLTDNNSTGSPNNGCYLRYSHSINSGKWQGICKIGASTSTCDTGATAAAGTWYNLKTAVNAAATSATFVVNDTSSCSVSSNIPTSNAVSPAMTTLQTAGSANMDIDYMDVAGEGLSR